MPPVSDYKPKRHQAFYFIDSWYFGGGDGSNSSGTRGERANVRSFRTQRLYDDAQSLHFNNGIFCKSKKIPVSNSVDLSSEQQSGNCES